MNAFASPQINELAAALAKAQGQITGALKDSANPFFKSKYADLASCWDACRKQLSENGLSVIQTTRLHDGVVLVDTTLLHSSGQWITGELPVKTKDDSPQAQGSGITYARRYALAAIVGVAQIDDDAEAAQGRRGVDDPRGEAVVTADPVAVNKAASAMTDLLNADVEEDVKACHIADYHDTIKAKHDLYIAASDRLSAKERGAWKGYVKMAQDMARREPMAANGRR